MSVMNHGDFGVNYDEYRFGNSKQYFRGPKPNLKTPYISIIGGGETFGRYVQTPFAEVVGNELPLGTANFGLCDAGPTFFLKEAGVLDACSRSKLCILSVPHGYEVSNRLYSVSKRENGKLKGVSETLQSLYPDVDFQSFRLIRAMLKKLHQVNSPNFKVIEIELRRAWVARMRELIDMIAAPVILLWFSERAPEEARFDGLFEGVGPQMVDREMLEDLQGYAESLVEYVASKARVVADGSDRVYSEGELSLAMHYPGGEMHQEVGELLYPVVRSALRNRAPHRQVLRKTLELLGF